MIKPWVFGHQYAIYIFILNSTHPWGLKTAKIMLNGSVSAAYWYGTGAIGHRLQDKLILLKRSVASGSSRKRDSGGESEECCNHGHYWMAPNLILIVCVGSEPGEAAGLAGELSATTGNLYIFAFPHIQFLIWTEKGGTSAKTLALVVH
jgi:hypothetical protein